MSWTMPSFCLSTLLRCASLSQQVRICLFSFFILYLTVWGVEPVVIHQTTWLESTGVHLFVDVFARSVAC